MDTETATVFTTLCSAASKDAIARGVENRSGFRQAFVDGMRDLAGAVPAVFAFGIGFGVAAVSVGLSPGHALAMSGWMFAGASQFAALDMWHHPLPMVSLAAAVFAVNARHIVLGATLRGALSDLPARHRYLAIAVLSDANWAATNGTSRRGYAALGHLVGGGAALWVAWMIGTAMGAWGGASAELVTRYGLDALMPAFFASMLIGGMRSPHALWPWIVAALTTAAAGSVVAMHWAVLIGAAAGAGFGYWRHDA